MVGVNGIVLILVWKRGVGVFFDQIKLSSRLPGRKERIKQILSISNFTTLYRTFYYLEVGL